MYSLEAPRPETFATKCTKSVGYYDGSLEHCLYIVATQLSTKGCPVHGTLAEPRNPCTLCSNIPP